jgi:hypothetical protein
MTSLRESGLDALGEWKQYIDKLRNRGITTVEQFVAVAYTPRGLANLGVEFGVSQNRVAELVEQAETILPASVVARLKRPVDVASFPLGALPPTRKTKSLKL